MKITAIYSTIIFLICILAVAACRPKGSLQFQHKSQLFDYYSEDSDRPNVLEIAGIMDSAFTNVCRNLNITYNHRIRVEVFPSQKVYDANVMNPDMKGTPAVSGNYRIQMVSPAAEIAVKGIPYNERLWFAVHEFTHLALDEIMPDMPEWLDEGVACYEGSYKFYSYICRHGLPVDSAPSAAELVNSYRQIPAADVYSFSFVEYLVHQYGWERMQQLLRSPDELQSVLGVPSSEISQGWKEFMLKQYIQE